MHRSVSVELCILVGLAEAKFSEKLMYLGSRRSGTIKVALTDLSSEFTSLAKEHQGLLESIKASKASTKRGHKVRDRAP